MSVLTDLILAQPEDAATVADAHPRSPRWPRIDAKGMDQLKLSTLWAILRGDNYDGSDIEKFTRLYTAPSGAMWVYRVPDDLIAALASLSSDRIEDVAAEWHLTDEMESGWLDDIEECLRKIKSFAEQSKRDAVPMLMWICL